MSLRIESLKISLENYLKNEIKHQIVIRKHNTDINLNLFEQRLNNDLNNILGRNWYSEYWDYLHLIDTEKND
jgi:hypothetical protein